MKPEKSEWLAYVLIAAGLILLILTFLIAYSMLTSLGGIATSRALAFWTNLDINKFSFFL